MKSAIFDHVPQELVTAVEKIEQHSGIPFLVCQATAQLIEEFPNLANFPLLDIYPEIGRICVWYPGNAISAADLSHELIHARRDVLQSVPRLVPLRRAKHPELIYAINNDLEHLFVIPEELTFFPEQEAKWADKYTGFILEASPNPLNLFRHWVVINTSLPKQTSLIEQCKNKLIESKLLNDAESFRMDIEAALPDKWQLIQVMLKWFPNIRVDVSIQRFSASNLGLDVIDIPF